MSKRVELLWAAALVCSLLALAACNETVSNTNGNANANGAGAGAGADKHE